MATLLNPFLRADDANGNPVSGGQLAVFEAGTTTPVTTYSDRALTTAQPQPLIANSAGEFAQSFVASGIYKIRVSDADGVTLYENDNVRISDRPDDPVFFDTIALLLASADTYAAGTLLVTVKEGARYTALASGATNFSDTNAGGQKLMRGYRDYDTVSDLLASVEPSRGVGSIWEAGGFRYEEVASGGDVTNAAGVQFDVMELPGGGVCPEQFGAPNDGTDAAAEINAAIAWASLANNSRQVHFGGKTYGLSEPVIYRTGVHLIGAGRQGTRLRALVSMDELVKSEDQTGATTYFRFGMEKIWLDGDGKVVNGVELRALRNGYFREVYTSGFTGNGWEVRNTCYYNTWWACEDNSPGRGWLIFEDGSSGTGSNENHWYSCRKNQGTDGWNIQAVSANLNSLKLVNCMVEAHSGDAVLLSASGAQVIWNCRIEGLRVDSAVSGSDSVVISNAGVERTHLQDIYVQGSNAVVNNGTETIFSGYPFIKTAYQAIDFPSISAGSQATATVTINGITTTQWVATANPAGGGAFSDGLILEARVSTTNTVKLLAHNKTGSSTDPVNQSYLIEVRRVR